MVTVDSSRRQPRVRPRERKAEEMESRETEKERNPRAEGIAERERGERDCAALAAVQPAAN